MNSRLRWILPIPLLLFSGAVWLYVETENEARVQILRAQTQWRETDYMEAIEIYESSIEITPRASMRRKPCLKSGPSITLIFIMPIVLCTTFRELVTQYPDSLLGCSGLLRLAEIHEEN